MRNGEFVSGVPVPGTHYRVLRLLGVGGMGSVYEVEHLELGKRFVLKALLSDLAMRQDLVARLRNEQRALGRLEHPNIVAVTDAGVTSQNVPFFVMERLDGETLAARLKRERRLLPLEALRIAQGVLEGLAAAHEIGVVHRDVKPPNIFLVAGNRPKILDFGVAKIADSGGAITARGVAVGTPRYMSPEQASGEPVDGRSDLYAVGLLLFEMVAGRGPFDDARDANELLLAQLGRRPQSLTTLVAGVTPELDVLVQCLLAKQPAHRPPNARAAVASVCVAQRTYGAPVPVEAATPAIGHAAARAASQTTLLVGSPTGVVTDARTLPRATTPGEYTRDTVIDDRGSTLTGELGTSAPDLDPSTRTEILPAVTPPVADVTETRTQVYITPPDGERTLDPVPVGPRPPSLPPPGASRARWALVGGVVALVGGLVLVRGFLAAGGWVAARPRSEPVFATQTAASVGTSPPGSVSPAPVPGDGANSSEESPASTGASTPSAGATRSTGSVAKALLPSSSASSHAAPRVKSAAAPSAPARAAISATGEPDIAPFSVPEPVGTPKSGLGTGPKARAPRPKTPSVPPGLPSSGL